MAFIPCGPAALGPIGQRQGLSTCTSRTMFQIRVQNESRLPAGGQTFRAVRMDVGVGSDLPEFNLPTNGGGMMSSQEISNGTTIMYFYPRDATPGCTTEAKDFRDLMPQLEELKVGVLGVSKDSVDSHDKFVDKFDLPFPLISDDGTLSEGLGVWKMRKLGPMQMMGIERSTFVIKDGKIAKEWRGVKSGGHAADVFEAVKEM